MYNNVFTHELNVLREKEANGIHIGGSTPARRLPVTALHKPCPNNTREKNQIMRECLECRRTSIINSYANLLRVSNVHESDHLCLMLGMWAFKLTLKLKAFKIILSIILIY